MGYIQTSLRFSAWALEFMLLPPVCIVFGLMAATLTWAGQKERPFQTRLWKPYHWLVFTHLLFFVAAIVLGVLCAMPVADYFSAARYTDRSAISWLDALGYGSFASCAFWIWRMKGFRWFAGSLMGLIELVTFGALFVARMSVTGDWL
jgi:hypothetical protein